MLILPQHSVMPYDTKNSQPKAAIARATTAGVCGLPPQDSSRMLDRSCCRRAGLLTSRATMVDAMLLMDTRSRSARTIGGGGVMSICPATGAAAAQQPHRLHHAAASAH
jgi:hypothetical protein